MTKLTYEKIHIEKKGKVSDKRASYLSYYDNLFEKYRANEISLLEIGVQNGGSLETWSKFFDSATCIIGCDIDERCSMLKFDDPRVQVVIGDANKSNTTNSIKNICGNFDIIIDDGSHISNDILNSFLIYFPLVKPGGLYVIEDTHTLYKSDFGGGILNEASAYSFFKKIVDVINIQFWNNEIPIDSYFRTFSPSGKMPQFIKEGWIDSVEFRNSLIILRKSKHATNNKLGERVITGDKAQVANEILKLRTLR